MSKGAMGRIVRIEESKPLIGVIELDESRQKIPFLQKDVTGYDGGSVYRFGLVEGSHVIFELDELNGIAKDVRVYVKPSLRRLAWKTAEGNVVALGVCLFMLVSILSDPNPDILIASLVSLLSLGCVWTIVQDIKKVYR